ncbi:MAG TPA: hypothetical protein VNU97_01750 [Rhizomicrobium sp.]|jgi:hypothetical protein|nr:hypothetical protein [Rhizomicrobium sp.]
MNASPYETVDEQWLWERGGLHDSTILAWQAQGGATTFRIKDVWWNSEGFPDYKGPEPGSLVISGSGHAPDCAPIVAKVILDAALIRKDGLMGLCLVTSEHPPIEILGDAVRWYPDPRSREQPLS